MKVDNNPNIMKWVNKFGELQFEIQPYDKALDVFYVARATRAILNKYKEHFVLSANGFVFDGLYETNRLLIKDGCRITDVLSKEVADLRLTDEKKLRQWQCRTKGHIFEGYLLPDVCPECRKESENKGECHDIWLSRFDEINLNLRKIK